MTSIVHLVEARLALVLLIKDFNKTAPASLSSSCHNSIVLTAFLPVEITYITIEVRYGRLSLGLLSGTHRVPDIGHHSVQGVEKATHVGVCLIWRTNRRVPLFSGP